MAGELMGEGSGNHRRGRSEGFEGLSFGCVGLSSGFLVEEDERWREKEGERLVHETHALHVSIAQQSDPIVTWSDRPMQYSLV